MSFVDMNQPEQITLKELGEKYLELYDPQLPEESQCTGWHELKRLVLSGAEELKDSDLVAFHPNLREVLRGHWGNIKKATVE